MRAISTTRQNPIWLPGRYNKFFAPRRPYVRDGLVQIPAGTSPLIRWPLFWLALNAPLGISKLATTWALASDGDTNLYFHPLGSSRRWTDSRYPGLFGGPSSEAMHNKVFVYLQWLMKRTT